MIVDHTRPCPLASRCPSQVLKCEKDLLDECELRQEGDRMVENKLLNHIHTLEKNMRDASQRCLAAGEGGHRARIGEGTMHST